MNNMSFLKQYIFKPRTVGALLPSSKYLAKKMVAGINFEDAKCIVEYGAGTGVLTAEIIQKRRPGTVVIIFEMNSTFCKMLNEKYGSEPGVHVVNDSAQHVGQKLAECGVAYADYVISGLPFASLPQAVSFNILTETKKHLKQGGAFITFQYTLLKKDFIQQFFDTVDIVREVRNVPPAYVLRCR